MTKEPAKEIEDLCELEEKLSDPNNQQMLKNELSYLINSRNKDTRSVSAIFRKIATSSVWSEFSYVGRRDKKSFIKSFPLLNQTILDLIISGHSLQNDIAQGLIASFLKAEPANIKRASSL